MRKRLFHIALLCVLAVPMLGAGAPSSRFNALGHKLMCVCGCGQILLECNHVGCPDSDREINELRAEVATGLPDTGVFNWFVAKYGPTVLAAPIRGGFDIVAWIVPFAALLLGIGIVIVLIRVWRRRTPPTIPPNPPSGSADSTLRDRIRQETTY
jgi:cytochrome c-type biogenesis protein CcmH/NrfF